MHRRGTLAVFCVVLLALMVGLVAGCSGGSQDGQQGGGGSDQGGGEGGGNAPESKIALGNIVFVNAEQESFTLRPNTQEQNGGEPVRFRLTPKATVQLEGDEASVQDMEQGQQAQVEYVVRQGSNRAKSVQLFPADDSGGESTN